jgi:hypothetical protein
LQHVSKQMIGEHVPAETNTHTTIKEGCFQFRPPRGIIVDTLNLTSSLSRVDAGSNPFTVTLRVVGGDKKVSLESETVNYGHKSRWSRTKK